ncbi:MAG TPA: AAA family ATPase [Polyangia bacterium]
MLRSTSALIGRGEQLAELARLLHEHPIVCVVGPLGIGKTALAIELLAREHRAGHLPPFARLSIAGATDERALLERTARALGREPPSSAPARIAATLRRMLAASPHAIFWDDAQQADLDAVSSLVRALELPAGGSRLLLASRAPLAGLELPSLELPPLGAAEARRLIHRLERERDLSLSETLVRRAAGNPLVLRLAAATLQDPAALEPEAVVRQAIAMLCREGAQPILALLSSLEGSISAIELKRLFPSARPIVDRLIDYGLLIVSGGEVEVPPALAMLIRERLGALAAESWEVLRASADRALSAAPTDPDSLLLACRALTVRGEAAQALALLERHSLARHGISSQALEQLLRSLATTSPERAGHARLILASEQLRRGDVGAALRSLEDLDPGAAEGELAARIEVIRARALARAGGLHTARGKLERSADRPPAAASDLSAQITVAAVAVMRGDFAGARAALVELAPKTRALPKLECHRALALSLSYFLEERFDRAFAWARRARRYQGHARSRRSMVGAVEVLALLGLDAIDRAVTLIDTEGEDLELAEPSLEADLARLYRAAVLGRRGDLEGCLQAAEPTLDELARRGDFACRAVLAHYMARAALGLGRFERAEALLRTASGIASEGGFAALLPLVRRDEALLAEAAGDHSAAQARIREAAAGCPGSPLIRIDAGSLDPASSLPPPAGRRSVRAYAALRAAERALAAGAPKDALEPARFAEQHYRREGAQLDRAQALLARAEAEARSGEYPEARLALESAEAIARPRGYAPLLAGLAAVRAAVADRTGALDVYVAALKQAAAFGPTGDRVALALARVGAEAHAGARTALDERVVRLGLDRPAARWLATEAEAYLLSADEPLPTGSELLIDLDRKALVRGARSVALTPQQLALVEFLCTAGGATLEEIYLGVLGGRQYSQVRHRSTVYVAITRLRAALDPFVGAGAIIERADGRYRLRPDLGPAVLCAVGGLPAQSGLAARIAKAGLNPAR